MGPTAHCSRSFHYFKSSPCDISPCVRERERVVRGIGGADFIDIALGILRGGRNVVGSERALWAPAGPLYGARSSDHRFTHLRNDDRSDTQRQQIHAIQSVLRARRLFQVHGTSAV
ncbi:hypothetical protein ACJJTC_012473 [Scirpophaga incertulas]